MKKKSIIRYAGMAIFLYLIYLGNVALQSHLGARAIQATGLNSIVLSEALDQSASSGKPVLVELSAVWCPSCRKLDKLVMSDRGVTELIEDRFIFSRLEYESEEAEIFMKKYQVSGFPTLLIFMPKQDKPRKLTLTYDPEKFNQQLKTHLQPI